MSTHEGVLTADASVSILKEIFRPASPTINRKLFKGRERELGYVLGAISDVGMHAVVYGEPGVGKTSLGLMAQEAFVRAHGDVALTVRIACSAEDDFVSVWGRLHSKVLSATDVWDPSDAARLMPSIDRLEDLVVNQAATPDTVTRAFHILGTKLPTLVLIDEFDRLSHREATTKSFADLVKSLSDEPAPATVLLIGVADNVNELVHEHGSIDRSLRQVRMPRMTRSELAEVVIDGVVELNERAGLELTLEDEVVSAIVQLSQGFPYYTHLLASTLLERAIREDIDHITSHMVFEELFGALESASQSIRLSYADAVQSNQNAQFSDTLLACALAKMDVLGFFAPADVVQPLRQITGTKKTTANFHPHLKRFSDGPSRILEVKSVGRRSRYRFRDPLMKPFVLMNGIREGRWDLERISTSPS